MDKFFGAFDEKIPSAELKKEILGNLPRAGGQLKDPTQYESNKAVTEEMKAYLLPLLQDSPWEMELHDFTGEKMARFVSKREIVSKDVKWLVAKLTSSELWRDKFYHVHTGAHCTEEGNIGLA